MGRVAGSAKAAGRFERARRILDRACGGAWDDAAARLRSPVAEPLERRVMLAANFKHMMPPRFGLDANHDGRIDLHNDLNFIQQSKFTVTLDASASTLPKPITSYEWVVSQDNVQLRSGTTKVFTLDGLNKLPEGVYTVKLTVSDGTNVDTLIKNINVQDILIVAMGDSIASGEGNPDKPKPAGGVLWADSPGGHAAHRSGFAASVLAAKRLEEGDESSSVTFVFLAVSGATISESRNLVNNDDVGGGLLDEQEKGDQTYPPQVSEAKRLVGSRAVDRAYISAGANDAAFSEVVKALVAIEPRNIQSGFKPSLWGVVDASQSYNLGVLGSYFRGRLGALPGKYGALRNALTSRLGVQPGQVYVTEYPDMTRDRWGTYGDEVMAAAGYEIDRVETEWARHNVIDPLNAQVRAAASKHGWNVVSYNSEFQYHGYTDPEPWVVRLAESSRDQRDQVGVLHPNRSGHEVIGGKLYERMFADKRPYTSFNSLFYTAKYSVPEGGSLPLGGAGAAGVLYEWDLDGDGIYGELATARGGEQGSQVTFNATGVDGPSTVTVSRRATDIGTNLKSTSSTTVKILNANPVASISGLTPASSGLPYTLNLAYVDGGIDSPQQWHVDWGDGNVETFNGAPSQVQHLYRSNRTPYVVSARVTDDDGTYAAANTVTVPTLPDTVGARVTGVFANGDRILPNEISAIAASSLVVAFSEDLDGSGGSGSVTNLANWRLTRNGTDVSSLMTGVTFAYNAVTRRDEATISLSSALVAANYVLTARQTIHDTAQPPNQLDGDANGTSGGDFTLGLQIASTGTIGGSFAATPEMTGYRRTAVAVAEDGTLGLAYQLPNSANGFAVQYRGYRADNQAVSSPLTLQTQSTAAGVDVAIDSRGVTTVAWVSTVDGWIRLARSGSPEFATSTPAVAGITATGSALANVRPRLAVAPNGDVVVTWHSDGDVWFSVYDGNGTPVGAGTQFVETSTVGTSLRPDVAFLPGGGFVLVWSNDVVDGNGSGIAGQRFNRFGNPVGPQFLVNTTTAGNQSLPRVASDQHGNFLVAWSGLPTPGVYGQWFDASGPRGSEFLISATGAGPVLASNPAGRFVVLTKTGQNIHAHQLGLQGALTESVLVGTNSLFETEQYADVAVDSRGNFTVTWAGASAVTVQRYAALFNTLPGIVTEPLATPAEGESFHLAGSFTDGDVSNTWTATVDWGDGSPTEPLALNADKTFAVDHVFADDGNYNVVVTVTDSAGGTGTKTHPVVVTNAPPSGVIGGASAGVPGQLLELSAQVIDAGSRDVVEAAWFFGDGSPIRARQPVSSATALNVSHAYAAPGTYTVSLWLYDNDGAIVSTTHVVEITPVYVQNGTILIGGTAAADTVTLKPASAEPPSPPQRPGDAVTAAAADVEPEGEQVIVVLNGIEVGRLEVDELETSVVVFGGDGNDRIEADENLPVPLEAYGGDGADTLVGGAFGDVLDGGEGNDAIAGGNGSDQLFGGVGTDSVDGGAGADVVSGGGDAADTVSGGGGGDDVSFEAAGSTSLIEGDVFSFVASGTTAVNAGSVAASHIYRDNGSYTLVLTLIDTAGASTTLTKTLTVLNAAPFAVIGGTASGTPAGVGVPVALSTVVNDDGLADTHTVAWTVKRDGTLFASGAGIDFAFTPDAYGVYDIALSVADDDGGVWEESESLVVSPAWLAAAPDAAYTITGVGGSQTLTVTGGAVRLTGDVGADLGAVNLAVQPGASVTITTDQHLERLEVDGAVVRIEPEAGVVLNVDQLDLRNDAVLDVSDAALIVRNGSAAAIDAAVRAANSDGGWTGSGIMSHSAAQGEGLTALGVAPASQMLRIGAGQTGLFRGEIVAADSVIVMYTYAGDANLDGFVSGDDYTAIDFAVNIAGSSGWTNGDFNYDGIISGDDYTVIDFNIVAQGPPLNAYQPLGVESAEHGQEVIASNSVQLSRVRLETTVFNDSRGTEDELARVVDDVLA